MPTANRGLDVKGMTMMRVAADVLIEALSSGMDPGSEAGRTATKAINDLGKHIPPGSINPQIYNATLLQLFNKQRQQAPMLAAMRSQGQQMPQPQPQGPSPQPAPPQGAPTSMAA